jgi:6,7-dimethyl-8-ribityllumazine synthase
MAIMNSEETSAEGLRFAVVASKYNEEISVRLRQGALDGLLSQKVLEKNILIIQVPGAFELPQVARKIAERREFDAIICVGTVLRGETLHFELISEECAAGIQRVAADFGIPVTFGVITADTTEQAIERSGSNSNNKGWEAALAAVELAKLYKELQQKLGSS